MRTLPRFPLADLPTPVHTLRRLSAHLGGPEILMKRDDMTGLALGGNKTRKLEYLVADALAGGADTLLTAGAPQSNHCRQTAAAAAKAGLRCTLLLGGDASAPRRGNLLLDELLGAEIRWGGADRKGEHLAEIARELTSRGFRPYLIPYGGSTPLGAAGYATAMEELVRQVSPSGIDAIVFASSSGGTHAGLITGARATGFRGRILGVSVEKPEAGGTFAESIGALVRETGLLLAVEPPAPGPSDLLLDTRFAGEGYGVVGDREREAIRLLARLEGILLDPVYTAKAMGGLIGMIGAGEFSRGETVLFWHTGGVPSLFAGGEALL